MLAELQTGLDELRQIRTLEEVKHPTPRASYSTGLPRSQLHFCAQEEKVGSKSIEENSEEGQAQERDVFPVSGAGRRQLERRL